MNKDFNTLEREPTLKPSNGIKIVLCLFIGCLSTFFAEVFSGSAPLWFLNPVGYLLILPVYMLHLLFLLNMAMRTKRLSIPQLYLWGIIFALYESWMTKVLWYAYPNEETAQFGLIFGIAIGEFFVLVFFYHPIFSFVIPILVFQLFASEAQPTDDLGGIIIPSHLSFLEKTKKLKILIIFVILFGASFIPISLGFNIFLVLLALIGNFCIISFLYWLCKRKTANKRFEFSIYSLRFGNTGLTVVISSLIILYLITFFLLLPERLPTSIVPYLIIIGFYILVISLIFLTKPMIEEKNTTITKTEEMISLRELLYFFIIVVSLACLYCFLTVLGFIVGIILYMTMLVVGFIIFIIVLIKKVIKR